MTLPNHVAIIMDGNGRWANKRNLPRVAGHKVGVESVRAVVRRCVEKKVPILTLFAFSTENWDRPKEEVSFLMEQLFVKAFKEEIEKLHENGVRLRVIGDIARLDKKLQEKIVAAEKKTANNSGLNLIIALSYSGRWDIVNAAKQICQQIENGKLSSQDVTDEEFSKYICLHDLPEPDLLIRTSGEQRISNFMLWQLAYTELYFTDVLWPDFREKELDDALATYTTRNRRFGKC